MIVPGLERPNSLGLLPKILIALCVAFAFVVVYFAVTTPWGFFLGGHFHLIPWWSGMGNIHVTTGRDYILYVRVSPLLGTSASKTETYLNGVGYLCTPLHEEFRLGIDAAMAKNLPTYLTAQPIHLRLYNDPSFGSSGAGQRPHFELFGLWRDRELSVSDRGSMGLAFNPDGSAYQGSAPNQTPSLSPLEFTLQEASYSDFSAACKALP